MRKWIVYALLFVGAMIVPANELDYFIIPDSLVAKYDLVLEVDDTLEAFKLLDQQERVYYSDRFELDKALRTSLAKFPRFHTILNNFALGNATLRQHKSAGLTPDDSVVDFVWLSRRNINVIKRFIRKLVKNDEFSEGASKFLHNMQGMVFVDSLMMRRYALSLFAASMGVCYDSSKAFVSVNDVQWRGDEVESLFRLKYQNNFKDDIRSICFNPEKLDSVQKNKFYDKFEADTLGVYKDCAWYRFFSRFLIHNRCSDETWRGTFDYVDSLYIHLLDTLVQFRVQKFSPFDKDVPVIWKTNGCGCSQSRDMNGEVYAIYPYWLAKKGGDTLDFSGITRIAYYGISANDKGTLLTPSGDKTLDYFNKKGYSEFVNVAHRHNVKVDWIVRKDDWSGLKDNAEMMKAFFDSLTNQVDSLVSKRINPVFQRFVNLVAINGPDKGFRGDGVTLWFQNYPRDSINASIFKEKFNRLQEKLQATNEDVLVNQMANYIDFTEEDIDFEKTPDSSNIHPPKGIYSYEFFGNMIKTEVDGRQRNFLIVLNDEPVSRTKRLIYNDLNQQLMGDLRKKVLHAVVPLLWLSYNWLDQLEDDASFYNDAYYALGIGPYGLLEDNDHLEERLSEILLQKFQKQDGSHQRQGTLAAIFCTYRWYFRLLNTIVYALVFLLLICYFAICRVNDYFSRHLALLLALVAIPPLLTSLILTNFDPVIVGYVGKVGQWGSFVVIILTVITIALLQVYRSAEFPRRK